MSATFPSSLRKALFVIILGIGFCLLLLTLIQKQANLDITNLIADANLPAAILVQLVALTLFIFAWYILVRNHCPIGFQESAAHVGVTLTGKYLPGKVWGLLGRSYLLTRMGISSTLAADLLIADQFVTFYTGTLVALLALTCMQNLWLGMLALPVAALLTPGVLNSYRRVVDWLRGHLQLLNKRFATFSNATDANPQARHLTVVAAVYCIHWVSLCAVLLLLFWPALAADAWHNSLLLLTAIPAGMLLGFLALWAPGGIGVREGVIIAVLASNMPLELATAIALTYRLLCIGNDLITGLIALQFYARSGQDVF